MSADERAGEVFRRAIDEARRAPQLRREVRDAPSAVLGFGSCFDFGSAWGGGGEARWDLALDWADEPPAPNESPARTPASDPFSESASVVEAVARELDFGAGLSAEVLAARWRAFVWRNHPDRQPAHARKQANVRVALANALYDRARCALRDV